MKINIKLNKKEVLRSYNEKKISNYEKRMLELLLHNNFNNNIHN